MNESQMIEPITNNSDSDIDRIIVCDGPPAQHDPVILRSRANIELCIQLRDKYPGLKFQSPLDMSQDYSPPEYLIEDTLVAGQPGIIAAAYKSMKTTLAIDMALSLATGQNFLGVYRIPTVKKVLLLTGESGHAKVQSTMAAWLRTKEMSFASLHEKLSVTTEVPNFTAPETLVAVETQLDIYQPEVVIIDPLYLVLNDEQASIINNGRQLELLSRPFVERGITVVMVDHFKVTAPEKRSPTLSSLSGAGKAAFFRQWILMNRSGKFTRGPQRRHTINVSVGGSQGHSWQGQIEIVEEFEDRQLNRLTCLIPPNSDGESRQPSAPGLSDRERRIQDERLRHEEARQQINQLLNSLSTGSLLMQTEIRNQLCIPNTLCAQVLDELITEGAVVKQQDPVPRRNGRRYDGYRSARTSTPEPS